MNNQFLPNNPRVLFIGSDHMEDQAQLKQPIQGAFYNGFEEAGLQSDYASLEEAVELFRPDLAVIGVPNYRKNRPACESYLIRRKIPVLIQKFRLADHGDFTAILEEAERECTPVFVGEFYRYHPSVAAVRRLIEDGSVGEPEFLQWTCRIGGNEHGAWEAAYGDLALEDLAFHHFSAIEAMMGLEVDDVYSVSRTAQKGMPSRGTVSATAMTTKRGCLISHVIDWHAAMRETGYFGEFVLEGSRGGVSLEGESLYYRPWDGGQVEIPLAAPDKSTALEHLLGPEGDPVTIQRFAGVMEALGRALSCSTEEKERFS